MSITKKGKIELAASALLAGVAGCIALAYFWQVSLERGLYADATHTDGGITLFEAAVFILGTFAIIYVIVVIMYLAVAELKNLRKHKP